MSRFILQLTASICALAASEAAWGQGANAMREDYCIRNPQTCRAGPSTTRPAPTQRTPASPTYQQGRTGNVVNPVPIIPTPPSLPSQSYAPPSAGAASSVLNSRSGMNLDFPTDEQPRPQTRPVQPKVSASPRPPATSHSAPDYTQVWEHIGIVADTAWRANDMREGIRRALSGKVG